MFTLLPASAQDETPDWVLNAQRIAEKVDREDLFASPSDNARVYESLTKLDPTDKLTYLRAYLLRIAVDEQSEAFEKALPTYRNLADQYNAGDHLLSVKLLDVYYAHAGPWKYSELLEILSPYLEDKTLSYDNQFLVRTMALIANLRTHDLSTGLSQVRKNEAMLREFRITPGLDYSFWNAAAIIFFRAGDFDSAMRAMDEMTQLSSTPYQSINGQLIVSNISGILLRNGHAEIALQTSAYLYRYASERGNGWDRFIAARISGQAHFNFGDYAGALPFFEEALVHIESIPSRRVETLLSLAHTEIKLGNIPTTNQYLSQLPSEPITNPRMLAKFHRVEIEVLMAEEKYEAASQRLLFWNDELEEAHRRDLSSSNQEVFLLAQQRQAALEKQQALFVEKETMQKRNTLISNVVIIQLAVLAIVAIAFALLRRRAMLNLQKARNDAVAANAAKSRFLADITHEIRTPLNGIIGMAQVLRISDLNTRHKEHVDVILESGNFLLSLINELLDLAKTESGKFDIATTRGNLNQLLKTLVRHHQLAADEKGLDLTLSFQSSIPDELEFDAKRVAQCLGNLISNAVKYTYEGRIVVSVSFKEPIDSSSMVSISVRDTGVGISEKDQNQLFQEFFQVDQTVPIPQAGSGLGLALSRNLARLMDGDVTVQSTLGEGSEFTFTFQAKRIEEEVPNISMDENHTGSKNIEEARAFVSPRVLVVDDNTANRRVIGHLLSAVDVEVETAENGTIALEKLSTSHFDCVLLDMRMPIMDGPTTLKHIRDSKEFWMNVPVIACTANAKNRSREDFTALGFDGLIEKPVDVALLLSELSNHVTIDQGTLPQPPEL